MGRLRVRAIMLNGTCIVGYADTGTQPSDFIGSSLPRAFGHRLQTAPLEA
jgi:hypothetical protein